MVRPDGTAMPVERLNVPAKPLRLVRVIPSVPVEPEVRERLVDFRVRPKSSTTTLILTALTRVSGLFELSRVE